MEKSSFDLKEDVFILGIRRSGNHAIANWLLPHYDGIIRYLNDYVFEEQIQSNSTILEGDPIYFYITMNGNTFCLLNKGLLWPIQTIFAEKIRKLLEKKIFAPFNLLKITLYIENRINAISFEKDISKIPFYISDDAEIDSNLNLFGLENYLPQKIAELFHVWNDSIYTKILKLHKMDTQRERFFILLLRDPFNNLASMMKNLPYVPPNHIYPEEFPKVWIAYAKEYLGETSFLSNLGKVITINYNLWFLDQGYRKKVSENLGKVFNDSGLKKVSLDGYGSSFDRNTYTDKADKMKVLQRWDSFKSCKEYRSILKNDELLHWHRKIYGNTPFDL